MYLNTTFFSISSLSLSFLFEDFTQNRKTLSYLLLMRVHVKAFSTLHVRCA